MLDGLEFDSVYCQSDEYKDGSYYRQPAPEEEEEEEATYSDRFPHFQGFEDDGYEAESESYDTREGSGIDRHRAGTNMSKQLSPPSSPKVESDHLLS